MPTYAVHIRCYAELNDHLSRERKYATFEFPITGNASARQMLSDVGIPVNEVEILLVNGVSQDCSVQLRHGDRISLYPVFESFDVRPLLKIRQQPLRVPKFIADAHLGRLARDLRLSGFDCLYTNTITDQELVALSLAERRTALSKDRELFESKVLQRGYYVKEQAPQRQFVEVLCRFDLLRSMTPFQRCLQCNTVLKPVNKMDVRERLPLKVRQYFDVFRHCPHCDRLYWQGSHFDRMKKYLDQIQQECEEYLHSVYGK